MIFRLIKISLIICMFQVSMLHAGSIESVFQDAARYTVKIETTTEYPYDNDSYGTTIGAGFLIDKARGWVLTNRHVAGDAPSVIEVRFRNSNYMLAEKLYLDPQVDLALLQIPLESIPKDAIEAKLECDEKPLMGNAVVIFGHPSGLNFTGTRGIISGTTFVAGNESLQTDAPLSSGNSVGPLISVATGKVVGVSEATFDEENSESLNLTVSIEHACKIVDLIAANRDPSPPLLPVVFMNYDSDAPRLVVAKSYYSDKSLLRIGDVITNVKGSQEVITNIEHLKFQLRGINGSVDLVIVRSGQEIIVTLPVTPHPKLLEQKELTVSGMTLRNYRPIDISERKFDSVVIVVHVSEGSTAYNELFRTWESFYSINGNRVFNTDEIYRALLPFNNEEVEVDMIVRWTTGDFSKIYSYEKRTLEVRDLKVL